MPRFMSPMDDAQEDHPTEDHSQRFRHDRIIRLHGYTIKRRPTVGEAVWEKSGREYTQSQVLAIEEISR